MQNTFDIVIIGSGIGGLCCAAFLSKEGKKVCVLEKNEQIGGNLQTFKRDGVTFDTGVHYIGSLERNQSLGKIFSYLGIYERLNLKRLNENCFDEILFAKDDLAYPHAIGFQNFQDQLLPYFPHEEKVLSQFVNELQRVSAAFPLYNLMDGNEYQDTAVFHQSAAQFIEKLTGNEKLKAVLSGSNILYAGKENVTPMHVFSLVVNSYIQSAYKCVGGSDQVAKQLSRIVLQNGGKIYRKTEVKSLEEQNGKLQSVTTADGEMFFANEFIANIHPAPLYRMLQTNLIRKNYLDRLFKIENSPSAFSVYIVCKPNAYLCRNRNVNFFQSIDVWNSVTHNQHNFPFMYSLYEFPSTQNPLYAEGLSLLTYMDYSFCQKWTSSFNTIALEAKRADDYEEWKMQMAEKLIALAEQKFPDIRKHIQAIYTSSPLTIRDYIGNGDGNMYGIYKSFQQANGTTILPITKIPNLYLCGQNIGIHGILGVAINALFVSGLLVGKKHLLTKIHTQSS